MTMNEESEQNVVDMSSMELGNTKIVIDMRGGNDTFTEFFRYSVRILGGNTGEEDA